MNSNLKSSKRFLQFCLLGMLILGATAPLRAESADDDFDYDIFLIGETLAVWIDIRPALDQSRMEDLLAGLDLTLMIDLKAERPRKLLFSKTLASTRAALVISHPLTEDFYRLRLANFGFWDRRFKSQIELSDFLADSLILRLAPKSLMAEAPEVRLRFDLVSKSHSSNILDQIKGSSADSSAAGPGTDEEFFESLFSFFLNLVGFGKTTFHIETPSFRIKDLPSF